MSAAQVLVGILSLITGFGLIRWRDRLPLRSAAEGRVAIPPMLWIVLGALLSFNGIMQLTLGVW